MKHLILKLLVLLILSSCSELIGINIECNKEDLKFTTSELAWGKEKDSLIFTSSNGDHLRVHLFQSSNLNTDNECPVPAQKKIEYQVINSHNISYFSFQLGKSEKYGSQMIYKFNSDISNSPTPVVGSYQDMGRIDIANNIPINTETTDFVQTTKLGTHKIGETTYENVFMIEDLDRNNVPEIDISKFYVNPSGILRIEFYDGEVWTRVE